ncbi:DUF5958 family protein [Streptomyces sp. NBC_00454]
MTERDVILNELAQGLRPMSQGIDWFDTHGPQEQNGAAHASAPADAVTGGTAWPGCNWPVMTGDDGLGPAPCLVGTPAADQRGDAVRGAQRGPPYGCTTPRCPRRTARRSG